ncbi:lipopolysaccharide-induced tumor necrosis factor-alpha factor homolog [Schistocerca gregaria]|uniref:lipopolysaccharide-induced tumor necrosis factor-alpha factor homolog n=1 Tax=Schistocerca gregaria TaxID=7010 RepID=UPI00211EA4F7|nr:lipopolysaccharide-induced tumor necrosis factor-alpha factor homolog [Schistocerca gregaria]
MTGLKGGSLEIILNRSVRRHPSFSFTLLNLNYPTVGPDSCTVVCPTCHQTVHTDVKVVSTTKTHLSAVLLAAFGYCLCCCVPYYVDSLRAKHLYCPKCKAFIAAYDRQLPCESSYNVLCYQETI